MYIIREPPNTSYSYLIMHYKVENMEEGDPLNTTSNRAPASSYYSRSMHSISRIMQKAVSLPFENRKLMLEAFIIVLPPFVILVLLHYLIAAPFLAKVEDGYENSSLKHQDLISLLVVEIPFAVAFYFLLLFSTSITILASVSTHRGDPVSPKDMLISIKSTWKRILASGLHILSLMIVFLGFTIGLIQLTSLMGILAALAYPYLASFCTLVLVISTVEHECQGPTAFQHAREIIREDTYKGYFLMLVLLLLSTPVYVVFYVTSTDDDDENGLVTEIICLLVSTVLFCLTNFFSNIVYTLFYLDYKQTNGEKIEELHSVPTATNAVVYD